LLERTAWPTPKTFSCDVGKAAVAEFMLPGAGPLVLGADKNKDKAGTSAKETKNA